ncbi:MAG: ABC transporter permease [Lachnospiraceae bacterium]|jgi:putative ABC transport system permease protein|nr:ABC transporter permease [Lachnospiraceae bacterium]
MSFFVGAMPDAISQGVLWAVMVLGVYITFKILDIADLTVDGSFSLGGCTCAALMYNGMNPVLALFIGFLAGLLAGAVTGVLHTVFEIPAILAGILTQISIWPINLKIMGRANTPLMRTADKKKIKSIFLLVSEKFGIDQSTATLIVGLVIVIVLIIFLYWFFGTELGSAIRATGNNEDMIRALGVNVKFTKLLSLMISNGLVGLAGGMVAQSQKYGDINMGTGAIVIGLAAIVIGEVLLGWLKSFGGKLCSVVVGSAVYFVIRAIVLELNLDANYMKLISAIIIAIALSVPIVLDKIKIRSQYNPGFEDEEEVSK